MDDHDFQDAEEVVPEVFFDAEEQQAERCSSGAAASTSDPSSSSYPAHEAAFHGDVEALRRLLAGLPKEQQEALDPQGNTVLHVAVLRKQLAAVEALLQLGLAPQVHNSRRWTPLDEAVSLGDEALAKPLFVACMASTKADLKTKKAAVMEGFGDMPNYTMKIKWEPGSSVFGLLLRKYAPHDTYTIWKRGTRLRVDGTWMGMDEEASSMIPHWKWGHFSLLFDGAQQPALILLVDHKQRTWMDLHKEKKKAHRNIDAEVRALILEGAGKTKVRTVDSRFKPVKTWLGRDATEEVEGWRTRIYEATGRMVAEEHVKVPLLIPTNASFQDYLQLPMPDDEVTEVPLDPLSMGGEGKKPKGKHGAAEAELQAASPEEAAALLELEAAEAAAEASSAGPSRGRASAAGARSAKDKGGKRGKAGGGRKMGGRCWMAEDFPMSLKQLLPLMDIIGQANKHLARISKFMAKYGGMDLFPVKVQIPLIMTVYLLVTFKEFRQPAAHEECTQPQFYELPPGYSFTTFKENMRSKKDRPIAGRALQQDQSGLNEDELDGIFT